MEKTVQIEGKSIRLKTTGKFPFLFRAQFKRDALASLMTMSQGGVETLNSVVFMEIFWCLAKVADPEIPEPMEFYDQFESFPVIDLFTEIQDMIILSMGSTVDSKKKSNRATTKK